MLDAAFRHRIVIGCAPDSPIVDDTLTGYEILTIVAHIRGLPASRWDEEISLLSSYLHCGSWLKRQRCADYSHGMRRKVAVACAYLGPVRFAVLDEPLNGLDPVAVRGMRDLMLYKKSIGAGTLVSSHILDFIDQCADDCMLMKQGITIYSGAFTESAERLAACPYYAQSPRETFLTNNWMCGLVTAPFCALALVSLGTGFDGPALATAAGLTSILLSAICIVVAFAHCLSFDRWTGSRAAEGTAGVPVIPIAALWIVRKFVQKNRFKIYVYDYLFLSDVKSGIERIKNESNKGTVNAISP